jgi:hypothetical protein
LILANGGGAAHQILEHQQPSLHVIAEVHAQHGESVVDKGASIAERLGVDELAKAVGGSGDGEIFAVPRDDLEEPAGRRAALMELPR